MMYSFRRSILLLSVILALLLERSECFTAPTRFRIARLTVETTSQFIQFPSSSSARSMCGLMDGFNTFMKRSTQKATASHILIKGGAEAANKLEALKIEINNSPVQFANFAEQYSQCPSGRSGGYLGEFGPGAMVKEFDEVVFNKEIGVVHGPIKTQSNLDENSACDQKIHKRSDVEGARFSVAAKAK